MTGWGVSGSATLPWGMLVTAPPAQETPCPPGSPPGPQPSQQPFPSVPSHHSPRCSGGRRPGRTRLTKSDTAVFQSQTSPSESLALAWPPALQVCPPQPCRGSRCGRGAVTEMSPAFSPVKWVRRPGLLTGLPSSEAQCCGGRWWGVRGWIVAAIAPIVVGRRWRRRRWWGCVALAVPSLFVGRWLAITWLESGRERKTRSL